MGRPTSEKDLRNRLSRIFFERRQKEQELVEQRIHAIAEETERNERRIICTLQEIDFRNSRLPREVLERKINPTQSYGDLELGAQEAAQWLEKHPWENPNDISPVDQKLLWLACYFKEAVQDGNVKRAYTAKEGLLWGLQEVREKLSKAEWIQIEQGASDLEGWINLVELAGKADYLQKSEMLRRPNYEAAVQTCEQKRDALFKEVKGDEKKLEAFLRIAEHPENCTGTEQEKTILRELMDLNAQNRECEEKRKKLEATQKELDETNREMERLHTKLLLKREDDTGENTSEWIEMGEY